MTGAPDSSAGEDVGYAHALEWILGRINYERQRPTRRQRSHFRLERMEHLLTLIGSPHESLAAVHLAGTKGKGSTAAMIASILREAGIRTGLFTSPHLFRFEERMQVDGVSPDAAQMVRLTNELRSCLARRDHSIVPDEPTFFEVATLLGWLWFRDQNAELVVLETGLGGRLDCTNVCRPVATVLTMVGLDHTGILGSTVLAIAREKAGILKQSVPTVSGVLHPEAAGVVEQTATDMSAPLWQLQQQITWRDGDDGTFDVRTPAQEHVGLRIPLIGDHQKRNASLAVAVADILNQQVEEFRGRVPPDAIVRGLSGVFWPLRFEVVRDAPIVVVDTAHNPDSVESVIDSMNSRFGPRRPRTLVFSASTDKDARTMLSLLAPEFDNILLTRFVGNPRAQSPDVLLSLMPQEYAQVTHCFASPVDAFHAALSDTPESGCVVVTGSLFLAAEAAEWLRGRDAR